VVVSCRYTVPPQVEIETLELRLQTAVAQVIVDQPLMQVSIVDEDKKSPYFAHVSEIDLSKHIEFAPTSSVETANANLATHLARRLDQLWSHVAQCPPWKVIVIPIQGETAVSMIDVAYCYHHAIGDGTSGSIFHSHLTKALQIPADNLHELSGINLTLRYPPKFPPPQEQLINFRVGWGYFLSMVWEAFGPLWLKRKPIAVPWRGKAIDYSLPYKTNLRIVAISSTNSANLITFLRAHSLTLTPFLHILILASISRRIPASQAPTFNFGSAISARRCIPTTAEFDPKAKMIVIVTEADYAIAPPEVEKIRECAGQELEEAFLAAVHAVKTDIDMKVSNLPNDTSVGMLKYVGDFHKFFLGKNGTERHNSWEVSNIGAFKTGHVENGWNVTQGVFCQSASPTGAAMAANVLGVAGGELTITMSWHEGVVESDLVNGVADDLTAWIRKLGEGASLSDAVLAGGGSK
jgi:hypothetical protein